MPEITTILKNEMVRSGAIPFSRFMELALYCPNSGYYERPGQAPGRAGDFYTSVSVGPMFGRLLAARFAAWLEAIPGERVQLVEAGAHDGRLAWDILSWLEDNNSPCWPRLEYWLIEPSACRRRWQAERLARYSDRLRWFDGPDGMAPGAVRGVIFSNELIDAFPVTRLRWQAGARCWAEMGVSCGSEGFAWTLLPLSEERLAAVLSEAGLAIPAELARVLPDGFTLDLTEGASGWWRSAAVALGQGTLMTIDYGCVAEGLLSAARAEGTLRAYRRHRLATDVLADPGEQDLTCHINFTQLQRAGEASGLTSEPLQTQARFLMAIVRDCWGGRGVETIGAPAARALQTLVHPEHLGSRFQVFIQHRAS